MIPRLIHFVWSGKAFPFAFSLAVRSAVRHNPGFRVILHVDVVPETPWWQEVAALCEVRTVRPEPLLRSIPNLGEILWEKYCAIAPQYHAGRSNLLRLAILVQEGGWYLDFDTLSLKPLEQSVPSGTSAVVGEEWVWKHDQERVTTGWKLSMLPSMIGFGVSWLGARWGFPAKHKIEQSLRPLWGERELNNAVLACVPNHPWFVRLLQLATTQDATVRFALGPALVNLAWQQPGSAPLPYRAAPEVYYQYPPSQTIRYFQGDTRDLPDHACLLHWCSSNHRELVAQITPEWVNNHQNDGPWPHYASLLLSQRLSS